MYGNTGQTMAFFQKRQTTENERRKALGKFKRKRWLAGAMAFMLCCTSFLQTGVLAVSAQDEIVQEEVQTLKSEEELIEETAVDPVFCTHQFPVRVKRDLFYTCLLYTSDAADE